MAKRYPELVFTNGPQRGQRVPLIKMMNIVGRDRSCDIEVQDEYASRQHARIIVEGSRVRLVNTSNNGTRVNGKIVNDNALLSSGDTLGFGLECEVRFEGIEGVAAAGPQPSGPVTAPLEKKPPTRQTRSGRSADSIDAEAEADKKKLKRPTMVIWICVYLGALVLLFLFINWMRGDTNVFRPGQAKALSDDDMKEFLEEPLPYETQNTTLGAQHLDQAVKDYEQWLTNTTGPEHMYRTLHNFQLALAYYNSDRFPADDAVHLRQMENLRYGIRSDDGKTTIREGLFDQVRLHYKNAYTYQRQGRWKWAQDEYHKVLKLIPDHTHPINKNVREQLNIVKSALMRQKAREGPREW